MKNITIYLIGGFGNNLFQINKGFDLSQKGYNVKYNDYFVKDNFFSRLLGWSVHKNDFSQELFSRINIDSSFRIIDLFYLIYFFILKKLFNINIQSFDWEPDTRVQVGYWQDSFVINKSFLNLFKSSYFNYDGSVPKLCCSQWFLEFKDYLVLHARLGDFSESIQLPYQYYADCILESNIKNVMVVTDTPQFISYLTTYLCEIGWKGSVINCPGNSVYEDFMYLANSSHLVMSNSTFCYWASQVLPVPVVYFPTYRRPGLKWPFPMTNPSTIPVNSFG